MQLPKTKSKLDVKAVDAFIKKENDFITNLLSKTAIPERKFDEDDEEEDTVQDQTDAHNAVPKNKTSRAKSFQELQQRLQAITSKKKLTYKEKITKKGLKNRMKKKSKQDERNAQQKLARAAKLADKSETETEAPEVKSELKEEKTKPVFNANKSLLYSKIDFGELGRKKKEKKQEKDPKKLLQKLKEEKSNLQKLEESGNIEQVVEIKEKTAWKNAIAKAEGVKVKDDEMLLKKSVKKKEQKVRSSKKKWEARIEGVKKAKEQRQNKRTENIQKRKKDKKVKKLKNASKRGKIIPGF